jgi:hypothetical protein
MLPVAGGDRFPFSVTDVRRFEETPSRATVHTREEIVGGEQYAFGSDDFQRPPQVAMTENASRSEVYDRHVSSGDVRRAVVGQRASGRRSDRVDTVDEPGNSVLGWLRLPQARLCGDANSRTIADSLTAGLVMVRRDIAHPPTADRILAEAVSRYDRIDTLIKNAGLFLAEPSPTPTGRCCCCGTGC